MSNYSIFHKLEIWRLPKTHTLMSENLDIMEKFQPPKDLRNLTSKNNNKTRLIALNLKLWAFYCSFFQSEWTPPYEKPFSPRGSSDNPTPATPKARVVRMDGRTGDNFRPSIFFNLRYIKYYTHIRITLYIRVVRTKFLWV